jgi:hypothetical protein
MPPTPVRLVAVTAALTLAAAASAQTSARSAEADIRLGLREAQRLADTDPAKAADKLNALLARVEADGNLSADRRSTLARVIRDRVRVAQAGPVSDQGETVRQKELQAAGLRRAEEQAKVKAGLEDAIALEKAGKNAEAAKRLEELTRAHPNDLSVQVEARVTETTARRGEAAAIQKDKEQRALAGLNSLDRSATAPKSDYELPADWKAKTERRRASTALTTQEIALLKALDAPIKAKFNNSPLQDAMDYLSTVAGLPIVIDKVGLDEASLTYNTPVTFDAKAPLPTRTVLRAILSSLGLSFVVSDGVVFVTTVNRAKMMLTTKVYAVGDLVKGPEFTTGLQEFLNATMLMGIVMGIEPDSWDARGGPGTVRYYPPTMGLIVRQSAEVHAMLKSAAK